MEPSRGRSLEENGMLLELSSKLTLKMKNRLAIRSDHFFLYCCKGAITAIESSINEKRAKTQKSQKREVFANVRDDDEDYATRNS